MWSNPLFVMGTFSLAGGVVVAIVALWPRK